MNTHDKMKNFIRLQCNIATILTGVHRFVALIWIISFENRDHITALDMITITLVVNLNKFSTMKVNFISSHKFLSSLVDSWPGMLIV